MADIQSYNIGESNYAKHDVQPWDVWLSHPELNAWECDIVKRILRTKGATAAQKKANKVLDLQKIKHICDYLIEHQDQLYAYTDD